MGTSKYYVAGFQSGICATHQEFTYCKTFIGFIIQILIYRMKYPQVNAQVRNGYGSCNECTHKEDNLLCKGKLNNNEERD